MLIRLVPFTLTVAPATVVVVPLSESVLAVDPIEIGPAPDVVLVPILTVPGASGPASITTRFIDDVLNS